MTSEAEHEVARCSECGHYGNLPAWFDYETNGFCERCGTLVEWVPVSGPVSTIA